MRVEERLEVAIKLVRMRRSWFTTCWVAYVATGGGQIHAWYSSRGSTTKSHRDRCKSHLKNKKTCSDFVAFRTTLHLSLNEASGSMLGEYSSTPCAPFVTCPLALSSLRLLFILVWSLGQMMLAAFHLERRDSAPRGALSTFDSYVTERKPRSSRGNLSTSIRDRQSEPT